MPWTDLVTAYRHDSEVQFSSILVSTLDTTRQDYMLELLMSNKHPVMFIGPAGTGKTSVIKNKLHKMDVDTFSFCIINLNCFTDSMMLQAAIGHVIDR